MTGSSRQAIGRTYEPMECACGLTTEPDAAFVEKVWSASSYRTCVYRCSCGRGYSNAAVAATRTCIKSTPEFNYPESGE